MTLREELCPPKLEEEKVRTLKDLAERLDGCDSRLEDCTALRTAFNSLAKTNLQTVDFHFSGAIDSDTFVRRVLTPRPRKVEDVSYEELLELMTRICNAVGSDYELDYWLQFLEVQLDNHKLSDLIYYPNEYFGDGTDRDEMTPKEILDTAIQHKPSIILLPPSNNL
ncbi:MAG TPA: hypothetical protein VNB22_11835 [Pyrinomonadaceae bacterium]|nr:hypothetical protein [Pyrinomonadaceae bacterium]